MALDGDRLFTFGAPRLDHIGINGALSKKTGPFVPKGSTLELGRLLFEHIHKKSTNDFAFGFWVADAGEFA